MDNRDYEFKKDEQIKCPICGESANYREFEGIPKLFYNSKDTLEGKNNSTTLSETRANIKVDDNIWDWAIWAILLAVSLAGLVYLFVIN